MADDDPMRGEVGRTFERMREDIRTLGDRLTTVAGQMVPITLHQALQKDLDEFKNDVRGDFAQVEKTAIERRDTLVSSDRALGRRIDGIEKKRTSRVATRIGIVGVLLTAAGLLLTLLSHGGR